MDQKQVAGQVYVCPMHRDVRQQGPGKCRKCGMDLLPEGTRFGMLRHMTKSPLMLVLIAVVMLAMIAMIFM
ncbi:MAG TPA: heavy metal-binding domain-containing protein [Burkholderiales bacterium]|nr:heavy metal-binding domain-containing protein [Burkholderiales bacterium]